MLVRLAVLLCVALSISVAMRLGARTFGEHEKRRHHGAWQRQDGGMRRLLRILDSWSNQRDLYFSPSRDWRRLDNFLQQHWSVSNPTVSAWWQGPNVCDVTSEAEEPLENEIWKHQQMTSTVCDQTDVYYRCTEETYANGRKTTLTTTYQCCHGYERVAGTSGCQEELVLQDLLSTLDRLNLTDLKRGIETTRLTSLLERGNYTIFAPVDGAFDDLESEMRETGPHVDHDLVALRPDSMDIVTRVREILSAHVVEGFLTSNQLEDDESLVTLNGQRTAIRINKYSSPKQMTTANCVPVQSADHLATNGVVHVVSRLLPVTSQTIADVIASDEQFTTLYRLLLMTGLDATFAADRGSFTLLAPTNEAFAKLGQEQIARLLANNVCLMNVLKAHVLPRVVCSDVIEGHVRVTNLLDEHVRLQRNNSDVFVEQSSRVTRADVMASNGVIHVIDDVIVPKSGLDVVSALTSSGFDEFVAMLHGAGLSAAVAELQNATIFMPSKQALQLLPADALASLGRNATADVLRYHIVPGNTELFSGGQLQTGRHGNSLTLDTLVPGKPMTLKQYTTLPYGRQSVVTAQCARVVSTNDVSSCNAVVHTIDKVLLPPAGSVYDVLIASPEYSTLVGLLREAGLDTALQQPGPVTIFAPTNQYWSRVNLSRLRQRPHALKKLLLGHVVADTICCAELKLDSLSLARRLRTLANTDVTVTRYWLSPDVIRVDDVSVRSCDQAATNGVVHSIDGVLGGAGFNWFKHRGQNRGWNNFVNDAESIGDVIDADVDVNDAHDDHDDVDDWPWWMRRLRPSLVRVGAQ